LFLRLSNSLLLEERRHAVNGPTDLVELLGLDLLHLSAGFLARSRHARQISELDAQRLEAGQCGCHN
jgi:uncharacterized membrane protein